MSAELSCHRDDRCCCVGQCREAWMVTPSFADPGIPDCGGRYSDQAREMNVRQSDRADLMNLGMIELTSGSFSEVDRNQN
jgi:hypothetical protein